MNLQPIRLLFLMIASIASFGYADILNDDPLAEIKAGLSDGVYLIKVSPAVGRKIFASREEAKAWKAANPGPIPPPDPWFYRVHISGEEFIVHLLEKRGETLSPAGNMFVSLSSDGSWFYREANNRILVSDSDLRNDEKGPKAPGFRHAQAVVREVRLLGLHSIDWDSIVLHPDDRISGRATEKYGGQELTGKIYRSDTGSILGVEYEIKGRGSEYRVNFNRDSESGSVIGTSKQRRHQNSAQWKPYVEYEVQEYSPLPHDLNMATYWMAFVTPETEVSKYEPTTGKWTLTDQEGEEQEIIRLEDQPVEREHRLILIVFLAGIAILPVVLLWRKSV